MLSEISQIHTHTNTVYFYVYEVPRVTRFIESRIGVARGWGEEGWGVTA